MALTASGQAFQMHDGRWSGPAAAFAAPGGTSPGYLSCTSPAFCEALSPGGQGATWNGQAWDALPRQVSSQGIQNLSCSGPAFCVSIDGVGDSFDFDGSGWSQGAGAWGAANGVSCVNASFCMAAEAGGPSQWGGGGWTQPEDIDTRGSLNAISCTAATFCEAVDSGGNAIGWSGSSWSAPVAVPGAAGALAPVPTAGPALSGLYGISCVGPAFCMAIDGTGASYEFDGAAWTRVVATGGSDPLTSISCAAPAWCTAIDASGRVLSFGRAG